MIIVKLTMKKFLKIMALIMMDIIWQLVIKDIVVGSYRIKKCHQESNYSIIIDECYSDYILLRNSCVEKCDINNYWMLSL